VKCLIASLNFQLDLPENLKHYKITWVKTTKTVTFCALWQCK